MTFGWGPRHIWLHATLEETWSHYMILEVCWDGLWTLSFGLSQFHVDDSWLVCEGALRVGSDYNEEVQWSRISGEWSNMFGYKMGSSPAKDKILTWLTNMTTIFAKEVLLRSRLLGNVKPVDKKFGL